MTNNKKVIKFYKTKTKTKIIKMGEMRKKNSQRFFTPMGVKAPKTIKKELRINILYEEVWNMLTNKVFSGIFETNTTSSITFSSFLLCIGTALFLGLIIAL